eukprot:TRINITY_DN2194_c0_g1_i2.p1 TRINITY_DN2194_c0_g1~~TRINITY_DN2194_c0_g1_i2.p1  ORF type:complete len:723 (+),score=144.15 TRINITY_DN2194_c0_g1_i2:77-2170(+)
MASDSRGGAAGDRAASLRARHACPDDDWDAVAHVAPLPRWAEEAAEWVDTESLSLPPTAIDARLRAAANLQRYRLRYAASAVVVWGLWYALPLSVQLDAAFLLAAACCYRALPVAAECGADGDEDLPARLAHAVTHRTQFRVGLAIGAGVAGVTVLWALLGAAPAGVVLLLAAEGLCVAVHAVSFDPGARGGRSPSAASSRRRWPRGGVVSSTLVASAIKWREGDVLSFERLETFLDSALFRLPVSAKQALFRAVWNLRHWHLHYAMLVAAVLAVNLALTLSGKIVVVTVCAVLRYGVPDLERVPSTWPDACQCAASVARTAAARKAALALAALCVLAGVGGQSAIWHLVHGASCVAVLGGHLVSLSPQRLYARAVARARDDHASLQQRRRAELAKGGDTANQEAEAGELLRVLREVHAALDLSSAAQRDRSAGRAACIAEAQPAAGDSVIEIAPAVGDVCELSRAAAARADGELRVIRKALLAEHAALAEQLAARAAGAAVRAGEPAALDQPPRGASAHAAAAGGAPAQPPRPTGPAPLPPSLAPGLGYGEVRGPPPQQPREAPRAAGPSAASFAPVPPARRAVTPPAVTTAGDLVGGPAPAAGGAVQLPAVHTPPAAWLPSPAAPPPPVEPARGASPPAGMLAPIGTAGVPPPGVPPAPPAAPWAPPAQAYVERRTPPTAPHLLQGRDEEVAVCG